MGGKCGDLHGWSETPAYKGKKCSHEMNHHPAPSSPLRTFQPSSSQPLALWDTLAPAMRQRDGAGGLDGAEDAAAFSGNAAGPYPASSLS